MKSYPDLAVKRIQIIRVEVKRLSNHIRALVERVYWYYPERWNDHILSQNSKYTQNKQAFRNYALSELETVRKHIEELEVLLSD